MSLENSIVSILSEAQCGLHHHQKLLKSLRYIYICTCSGHVLSKNLCVQFVVPCTPHVNEHLRHISIIPTHLQECSREARHLRVL